MINIELTGTSQATSCGQTIKTSGKSSPIPKLARKLIEDGYAAHDIARVTRGDTMCFHPTPLSWWAARDIVEGDASAVKVQTHRPFSADVWAE